MLIWGAVCGALLGFFLSGLEGEAALLGCLIGLGMGAWLQRAVRAELRALIDREGLAAATAPTATDLRTLPPAPAAARAEAAPARESPWEQGPEPSQAMATAAADARADDGGPGPVGPEQEARRWLPDIDPIGAAKAWLFGGNTIVRVGLVVLFVGLSFLASYAAQAGLFPLELRLAAVAAAGVALLVVGFVKRTARPDFGLALQGTGVAVIYLTLFAAARLFPLLPLGPALGLMLLVCALGCALALLQGSQALAFAAFAGGFAAPVLLGGDGSVTGLFAYYAILNLAVLVLTWKRGWRAVALVAFVATFGVMAAWVADAYTPADFGVAQGFLLLFVAIHLGNAVLVARPREGMLDQGVQSTLLFGPALAGFGIQSVLVRHIELGAAFAALGFAALYLGAALLLRRRAPESARLLVDGLLAIGVGFVTLAVPLAFGARWTSAVWALEGAAAFWLGQRQGRWLPRAFGLALVLVASALFLVRISSNETTLPLVGPMTLGAAMCAAGLLAIAWWLRRVHAAPAGVLGDAYQAVEARAGAPLFVAGFLAWATALALEAWRQLPPAAVGQLPEPALPALWQGPLFVLGLMLSAALAQRLAGRFDWPVARWPSLATLPLLLLFGLGRLLGGHHVPQWPDALLWVLLLGLHGWMLRRNDREAPRRLLRWLHVGSTWLVLLLLADALWFLIDRAGLWDSDWAKLVLPGAAIAVLAGLALWAGRANRASALERFGWPLKPQAQAYWWLAALPVAGLTWLGAVGAGLTGSGDTAPLPYIPLLNPMDLALALAVGSLLLWRRTLRTAEPVPAGAELLAGPGGLVAIAALAFIALNTAWLRFAHQMLAIDWSAGALMGSGTVQAGLTILWALLAVGLMLLARRNMDRTPWFAGAGLLGVVVLKLLLVDMSSAEGWQRIVAFIAVGVLMLLVGYLVPLPPKDEEAQD